MKFFNFVHRSIFDSSFYIDIATFSKKRVAGYFIKLLFLTVIVTGLAHAYYLFHPQRGVSSKIEAVFSGMEIINGVLHPNRPTPYFPPPHLLRPVWEQILGTAQILNSNADSMLVVDTTEGASYPFNVSYVFKKQELVFMFNNVVLMSRPYDKLLHSTEHFKFSSQEIRQTLYHNGLDVVTSCLTMSFLQNFFLLIFSIFFLGTAAFIFRVEGKTKYFLFLKTACFAVTPIAIGTMMIGLSGVRLSWTWHILIFISTVVMFRAIIASTKPKKDISNENTL